MTKLPDFYTVVIKYEPDKTLVELKSLKYYLASYRNVGILHEELVNAIVDDLVEAVHPRWISVDLGVNVRGGIATTIHRERGRRRCAPESRRSSREGLEVESG